MSHRRYLAIIRQQELNLPTEEPENTYSHTVLVGNWYEERFASKIDRKAITPGIYGESKCLAEKSLYKNDFKIPIKLQDQEEYKEFLEWKQQGFANRLMSEKTNIKLCHGEEFNQNYTTIKDIMYRIKPGEQDERAINEDYMRSYGNSTQTGLLQWRRCEMRKDEALPLDVSHYKNNFKVIKIPAKRYHLQKALQRKTSI